MTWYLARRLQDCFVAGRLSDVEEDFFVVKAGSLKEARKEAARLSKTEETSYLNVHGQEVTWRLRTVTEVIDLGLARLWDGTWLYSRTFPGVSRLAKRSKDRLRVEPPRTSKNGKQEWYGAMLMFRSRKRPVREEERLLLLSAASASAAARKALWLGNEAADASEMEVVGLFDVHDVSDEAIRSGTEIYSRFFRPSSIKKPGQPPRQGHLTVPEFSAGRMRAKASA